ncbi:BspA family leucine-rich repeat surface protein, partial [Williamsoniiplasma luminosum]
GAIAVKKSGSSRAHHPEEHYDQYTFTGDGNIDNEFEYTGSITLTHNWTKKIDNTKPIGEIKEGLQAILDQEEYKYKAWNQEDLQSAIDKEFGIKEIEVTPVNALTRSFDIAPQPQRNKWKFVGNGSIDNEYKWNENIELTHKWEKKIDTTKNISEIKKDLEKIVRSQEEFWNAKTLENKVSELYPKSGIKVIEQKLLKSEKVPITKWKFIGEGSIENDYIYNGELEIYQIKDMQSYPQTIYIDAKTQEIKSTNDTAPQETKEVLHIGFGMDNEKNIMKAHKMPKNIEKVPNYISPQIKSLYKIFDGAIQFNDSNVSEWDTSNVEIMKNAFMDAESFNQELNDWNVSNVWDMNTMFIRAKAFNQDLNNWETSKVQKMSHMFQGAEQFNGNISTWDTSNVTEMQLMFQDAESFNQDLTRKDKIWDTSNVTDMTMMFDGAKKFNGNISNWDTLEVKNMGSMFQNAQSFNVDISNWNTSNVTDMSSMFKGANKFNRNINTVDDHWNTSNVTDMSGMFSNARVFNADITNWNTSNVTDMSSMFENAKAFNADITNWNTSKVTNMSSMF